jgi:hypothetical protein
VKRLVILRMHLQYSTKKFTKPRAPDEYDVLYDVARSWSSNCHETTYDT